MFSCRVALADLKISGHARPFFARLIETYCRFSNLAEIQTNPKRTGAVIYRKKTQ
jgi:hypothetical protein